MEQILPRLFLGSFEDAEAVRASAMTAYQVHTVLTLCESAPSLSPGLQHVHAPIPDEVFLERHIWAELVHALRELLSYRLSDGTCATVLVHCRLGVSRAPSLVAAYLAQCGWTLDTALALIVSRRGVVAPHAETWRGVRQYVEGK